MFTTLKPLDAEQQRQLVRLLDARIDLGATPDDEVFAELVAVLRDVLQVPANRDVPEYMRRRLVEVVIIHFELIDNLDRHTDIEVAKLIAEFAFEAASQLTSDDERRGEFEQAQQAQQLAARQAWRLRPRSPPARAQRCPWEQWPGRGSSPADADAISSGGRLRIPAVARRAVVHRGPVDVGRIV